MLSIFKTQTKKTRSSLFKSARRLNRTHYNTHAILRTLGKGFNKSTPGGTINTTIEKYAYTPCLRSRMTMYKKETRRENYYRNRL